MSGVFTNHAEVAKHECPKCGAQPGEWECRGIFGVHDERWHLVFPPKERKP
jgi:hypothetical protein